MYFCLISFTKHPLSVLFLLLVSWISYNLYLYLLEFYIPFEPSVCSFILRFSIENWLSTNNTLMVLMHLLLFSVFFFQHKVPWCCLSCTLSMVSFSFAITIKSVSSTNMKPINFSLSSVSGYFNSSTWPFFMHHNDQNRRYY